MGKPLMGRPNPKEPLIKGQGSNAKKFESNEPATQKGEKTAMSKPRVPTVQDAFKVYKELKSKNCESAADKIKENAIRNIASVPRKPKAIYVDTNTGNKNDLVSSGLVPRYRNKTEYGEVPDYIKKRKIEVESAQEAYDQYFQEQMEKNKLKQLTTAEHNNLLFSLKSSWESLHHKYQGLSVVTDTAPKKFRKEKLENQMSLIEKDIELLERNACILIDN